MPREGRREAPRGLEVGHERPVAESHLGHVVVIVAEAPEDATVERRVADRQVPHVRPDARGVEGPVDRRPVVSGRRVAGRPEAGVDGPTDLVHAVTRRRREDPVVQPGHEHEPPGPQVGPEREGVAESHQTRVSPQVSNTVAARPVSPFMTSPSTFSLGIFWPFSVSGTLDTGHTYLTGSSINRYFLLYFGNLSSGRT